MLAGSSGGDSSSDAPPTDPPVTEPPVTDPPDDGGGTEESQAGIYNVNLSVASNPGDQPVLLQQLVLQLEIIGTALTITQLSSNPNFPAQLSGTIADTSFSASANGVYSGINDSIPDGWIGNCVTVIKFYLECWCRWQFTRWSDDHL